MADIVPQLALANAMSGSFGRPDTGEYTITLRALPEGHVIQVLASPGAGDLAGVLMPLSNGGPYAVRASGPGQWLIVGEETRSSDPMSALERGLGGKAALIDQSHGRIRILIEGGLVEVVLSKACGADFDLSAFPAGHSIIATLAHVSTHVTRMSPNCFELIVTRSFAEHVWGELIEMAREFGVSARLA